MNIDAYISSGIIEQYVMGLCSQEESDELELLRKQYPQLNLAITDFELSFEKKMMESIRLPHADTDKAVLQKIYSLQHTTPVVHINSHPNKSYTWLRAVAAAAVILLGVSAVYNYTLFQKTKEQEVALIAKNQAPPSLPVDDFKVLTNPSITPVAMYGVGTHAICRCTLFWDKKTGKAYVMIHHLANTSDQKDYQLWATVDGKPVNVGKVDESIRGRFVELANVPAGANAFSITLENAGPVSAPNLEETYLEGKI